ncbi:hypothetical protein NE619_00250 [Anaerovorax odorimutans]|uniref:Uncharacterized protein n=1 Tax=Anaerovorax odorimutans TaxID=109327 RepID=A0ABT1RJ11_9FIRM|nr:hypothetical protein [Anaerovorax odorimutans]MCQ4635163.1 hypothetical protein [Anaerovorax odorimutans]
MNPISMNRGYRRLFWGTFFMLLWGGSDDPAALNLFGIIGLCCCISGAGLIFSESDCRRFLLARRWAQAGIVVWFLQETEFLPNLLEVNIFMPWSLRFIFGFLVAAVTLQVYVHVLVGAGEILGGTWVTYFSKRAVAFAGIYTIAVVANMVWDLIGGTGLGVWDIILNVFIMLYVFLTIWLMCVLAQLRRKYPSLTT